MPHLDIVVRDRGRAALAVHLTKAVEFSGYDGCAVRTDGPYCPALAFMPWEINGAKMPRSLRDKALAEGYVPSGTWQVVNREGKFAKHGEWVAVAGDLVYRRLSADEYYKASGTTPRLSGREGMYRRGTRDKWDVECLGPLGLKQWPNVVGAWITDTVRNLSWQIATGCVWDNTPILADALQDAGCDDEPLLGCLRSEPGPTKNAKRQWAMNVLVKGIYINDTCKGAVFHTADDFVDGADGG